MALVIFVRENIRDLGLLYSLFYNADISAIESSIQGSSSSLSEKR